MRTILQFGVMVLMLLGAGNRVWGRMASGPPPPARWAAEVSPFRLGGAAPPALPASGEAAMWGVEVAGAGNARLDSTPTMAGLVAIPVRGTAFMACPGSPPPSSPGATTNLAWMQVGPNVYAYVKQNPWTGFDPHGLWNAMNMVKNLRSFAQVTRNKIAAERAKKVQKFEVFTSEKQKHVLGSDDRTIVLFDGGDQGKGPDTTTGAGFKAHAERLTESSRTIDIRGKTTPQGKFVSWKDQLRALTKDKKAQRLILLDHGDTDAPEFGDNDISPFNTKDRDIIYEMNLAVEVGGQIVIGECNVANKKGFLESFRHINSSVTITAYTGLLQNNANTTDGTEVKLLPNGSLTDSLTNRETTLPGDKK